MINNPLVSVVVITYNSASTIIETLDSIREQSYKNIELIISDDCSKDNTVDICKKWLLQHEESFVACELVTCDCNTGVAPNLNRGIRASKGVWVKSIAGDDTLSSDCIQELVNYVLTQNCEFCVCDLNLMSNENIDISQLRLKYDFYHKTIKDSYRKQLRRICKEYTMPGPGFFYSRNLYNLIEGFDEKYPFCEEWPFVFKVLRSGIKPYACSHRLVNYRISKSSLCREQNDQNLINYKFYSSVRDFYFDYLHRCLISNGAFLTALENYIHYRVCDLLYGNPGKKSQYYKLLYLLSPKHYYIVMKRLLKHIC